MCFGGGDAPEPEESKAKLAMAETAATVWNRFQSVLKPLQNIYIDKAVNSFNPENYEKIMGSAVTQASRAYESKLDEINQQAVSRGLDPTSGAFRSGSDALRAGQARAMGENAAGVGLAQTDKGFQRLENVMKMGAGIQTNAAKGLTSLVDMQQEALDAQAESDYMRSAGRQNLYGTVAGAAGAYGLNRGSTYG